jgi:hypothetical protein
MARSIAYSALTSPAAIAGDMSRPSAIRSSDTIMMTGGSGESLSTDGPEQRHGDAGPEVEASVLGSFEVRRPDAPPVVIAGERIRTVLGVMVIDQMLATPFSYREFCRLTAGNINDPERERKIMNMGVKRLGELLGSSAISRDGTTPRLNLDHVRIDLLDVDRLVRRATEEAHSGALRQALDSLSAVLDHVQGATLFPGLDHDIFEAAREEFRTHLRAAILSVARSLLHREERGVAEAVIRRGLEALPADAEISRMLLKMHG